MTQHKIKAVSPWFEGLADGTKTFEVRWNDRHYEVGDTLVIEHWAPVKGSEPITLGVKPGSATLRFEVSYVYAGRGPGMVKVDLLPGYVVLGLKPLA